MQTLDANAARGPIKLAHDEPNTMALVRSGDAIAYADKKADTDRWQRGKQARGCGRGSSRSRGRSIVPSSERGNYDVMLSHAAPSINVRISLVSSETSWSYMLLNEHRFCSGPLDGESSDPGDRIRFGAVESDMEYRDAEGGAQGCRIKGWNDRVVRFDYVNEGKWC
ncbi:hypothetical protein QQS21_012451 [Conoideocrella luteorostrata]|uniref:Uncharacterized protein n=1 Tax=Conoideocrella luteorostrata TaxID=1105319 RepID=A0AAJ0CB57_9HYPO|nr:hypothetical protein QQS21_012451 [Conoideocrella luteorostrata]